MQDDGNLVLYGRDVETPPGNLPTAGPNLPIIALWASGTDGRPGSSLVMQDDGNAVIYQPNVPVWATDTVQG